MIVVDASALLELLLRTPSAAAIEARLFDLDETLHVPHAVDVEIAQVLRRIVAAKQMDAQHCRVILDRWLDVPVKRYPHNVLLPRIWELRQNLSAYDAVYVALAEALDIPLVTHDARLANAPGHTAKIELI
ncbi:MAG: type II toxin-antitoxin system VapC family toxin [Alphaproteobacteria bacterium]|nr:type II toxin-antitoxin system VapC family toxin [Alphaproteobacteria bacterium]